MTQNNANNQSQWLHEPIVYPLLDGQIIADPETDQTEARSMRARGPSQIDNSIPAQADASLFGAPISHASGFEPAEQAYLVRLMYICRVYTD